jgi:hypothetical protein
MGEEELARTFDQLYKTTPEEDLPEKLALLVQKRIFRIAVDALKYPDYLVS